MEMDAIIIDIYHFRVINERFGNAYGDEVLRKIGHKVREMVADTGGIVCRREADTFMVYCPHGKDYKEILDNASRGLSGEDVPINRIRLRMGVYAKVDRSLPIERRFDRAKMAVDMIRNSYTKTIEVYDHRLHEKEVFEQQLVEGFHEALREHQFKIYYQPKFDVRGDRPILTSAEALVRWLHPQFGFISPGQFIPLFESNGLIEELDLYVWSCVAEQIRDWLARLGFSVPVSVNVSRVDMYNPHLVDTIRDVLVRNGLSPYHLPLEVTESAYTQDSEQIISMVNQLRKFGFRIEMDDFGNGYSSLNMLSTLPIDALKLDMDFVQNAFRRRNDTRMLEIIVDIADYLDVPVIAEGVETEEQYKALKGIGCDIVQGFYFSRPVPAERFEKFLLERKALADVYPPFEFTHERYERFGHAACSLTGGYEVLFCVDAGSGDYVELLSEGGHEGLRVDNTGKGFFADVAAAVDRNVYEDDRAELHRVLQRDRLTGELERDQVVRVNFRMLIDHEPVYYCLRAVKGRGDGDRVVIGVSNVDHDLKTSGALELIHPNAVRFEGLAGVLGMDTESVYYVDLQTDNFLEFHTGAPTVPAPLSLTGRNFFKEYPEAVFPYVYHGDQGKIGAALDKSELMDHLRSHGEFSLNFRMNHKNQIHFYRLRAAYADRDVHRHAVIGLMNIDERITDEERMRLEQEDALTFVGIAKALARDYFSIYIVDVKNDRFLEYNADRRYKRLGIEQRGENFFELSRRNAEKTVYADDLPRFLSSFTKVNVLNALRTGGVFTMTYRLVMDDQPTYVSMKVSFLSDDEPNRIVVGINNIQAGMDERDRGQPFSSISRALAGDYTKIYYLDIGTDDYIEFGSGKDSHTLEVERAGSDFFEAFRKGMRDKIHPDDAERFEREFTRERFYEQLGAGHAFVLSYRQLMDGRWVYVQMRAVPNEGADDRHVIIGISDIDERTRREEKQMEVLRQAQLDPLTGVGSKGSFREMERTINKEIRDGSAGAFAIVYCDINDLKSVNDRQGHAEGDEYIKQAARIISHIYKGSAVFRVGGDEFIVVLRGADYEKRDHLYKMISALNYARPVGRPIVIAVGMAVFDEARDMTVAAVTERADKAMYENKRELKENLGEKKGRAAGKGSEGYAEC